MSIKLEYTLQCHPFGMIVANCEYAECTYNYIIVWNKKIVCCKD